MDELLSVGLDVGTTTSQMIVSRLRVENKASSFAVPRMEIVQREIVYESPIHFTPLLGAELVDGQSLRSLIEGEYRRAGITREQVDTGAIIVTGETSRKENAEAVARALSDLAGNFVVATAGPDLESALAARGAGALAYSRETGKSVLHMDIGGGTSNLAWIEDGRIIATSCLNVGGRLVKLDEQGTIQYLSPVLRGLCELRVGQQPGQEELEALARMLVSALEAAAGLGGSERVMEALHTVGSAPLPRRRMEVLSFSGGVADCIHRAHPYLAFGDLGALLGSAIGKSKLCQGPYRLGEQTIRATVIGAGCHSVQLSGSTVYCRGAELPKKDLPVACITPNEQESPELAELMERRLAMLEGQGVLFLPGWNAPSYARVTALADAIVRGVGERNVLVALEADMAKALGHALALRLPESRACMCIDGVSITPESYLDIGKCVAGAYPVVIKTLIWNTTS